jgi:hypothetical protein
VGGGGRLLLNEPEECEVRDCDACEDAYAAGGRCAMAPSTADRLELDHGVGNSLPKVAGMLGREARDGDGAGIGGGAVTFAT